MTDCNAGGCILRQGKLGRSMYFVRSGFVDLVMDGAVVDTIQAGDYFGEVALLSLPPTHELLKVPPVPPLCPPPPPAPPNMQASLFNSLAAQPHSCKQGFGWIAGAFLQTCCIFFVNVWSCLCCVCPAVFRLLDQVFQNMAVVSTEWLILY